MQNEREFLLKEIRAMDLRKCAQYIASKSDYLEQSEVDDLPGFNVPDIYYTAEMLTKLIKKSKKFGDKIFVFPEDKQLKNIEIAKIINELVEENYLEFTLGGHMHYKLTNRAIEAYKSQFI